MNADGTNRHAITPLSSAAWEPCWAPSGTALAFVSDHPGNKEIFKMLPGGGGRTRLTNKLGDDVRPCWGKSP